MEYAKACTRHDKSGVEKTKSWIMRPQQQPQHFCCSLLFPVLRQNTDHILDLYARGALCNMQWEQLLLCWSLNKIGEKKSIYYACCFLEWRSSIPGHSPHFKPPPCVARELLESILDFQSFEGRGSVWFAPARLATERKNAQIWALRQRN